MFGIISVLLLAAGFSFFYALMKAILDVTRFFINPHIFEVRLKVLMRMSPEKQSYKLEYIIIQLLKSVSIWNKSPINYFERFCGKRKARITYTIICHSMYAKCENLYYI